MTINIEEILEELEKFGNLVISFEGPLDKYCTDNFVCAIGERDSERSIIYGGETREEALKRAADEFKRRKKHDQN